MNKKIICLILSFIFSFFTCKALDIEVWDGHFSFIINTTTNKAKVRDIYFKIGETKDIIIPYKINWCGHDYIVTEILDYVIKDKLNQISSIVLPSTFEKTLTNRKAIELLYRRHIPVIIKNYFDKQHSLNFRSESV